MIEKLKTNQPISASDVWETILRSHRETYSRYPNGSEGLEALQRIRDLLGPDWDPRYEPGIWLKYRLWRSNEPGYSWLCDFAKKLEILLGIPGANRVIQRLSNGRHYQGAWSELDFALKLSLSGFDCKFVQTTSSPTPDLVANRKGTTLEVEVTSMSPLPTRGLAFSGMHTVEWTSFTHSAVARGLFSRVPKPRELELIEEKVKLACEEANNKNGVVKLNIRGLMTYYIAPKDLLDQIPERWRQSILMKGVRRLSATERLVRIIDKKSGPQLEKAKTALIAIYDELNLRGFQREETGTNTYDNSRIELSLGGFPNVVGAVLVQPFISVIELEPKNIVIEGRRLIEHSLPDFEAERCTIWNNPMSDNTSALTSAIDCLVSFPSAIRSLFS